MWWFVYYILYPAVIGIAIYWYLNKNYSYWKNLDIPYVKDIPLFGSLILMIKNPLHEIDLQRYKKHGRIHGYYEGLKPVLSIADPDLLKNILVKDFQIFPNRRELSLGDPLWDKTVFLSRSEDWKRIRTLITPAFTTGKIKKMVNIILDSAKTVARNFDTAATTGKPINVKSSFEAFTLDVIASAVFATKVDSFNRPDHEFVAAVRETFGRSTSWLFILFFMIPRLMTLLGISFLSACASKIFKDEMLNIINERRKTGMKRNDFLQLMIDAVDRNKELNEIREKLEEEDEKNAKEYGHEENNDQIFKMVYKNKSMTHEELMAQCAIFLIAGSDTASSALSFVCYELALNPEVQEKLISEIDETIAGKEEEFEYESFQRMKYLDKVISETLRLFPPALRLDRMAEKDYKLGDTGITIPKGMLVTVPIYPIHHDPEFYPEPEKFDPDRFSPEAKSQRHSYAYLPFGAGPRNCIGMRFALMEIKICLAYLLSNFRFKSCAETKAPLKFCNGLRPLSPKKLPLIVERRHDRNLNF